MPSQQIEIMVRGKSDAFSARLRLFQYDSDNDHRVFESELPWKRLGEYCDTVGVDKYRVGHQEINDVVTYDQRTVDSGTMARFGFKEVTEDSGPVRTRIVRQQELAAIIEECRVEGYKLNNVSPPNQRGEITAVFERGS